MIAFIALLRGINVSGQKKVPMLELRALCEELGFADVKTYIQSGNLLFRAPSQAEEVEAKLEEAIAAHFGFSVDVLVRTAQTWPAYLKANPFMEASEKEPHRVLMTLAKRPPKPDAVTLLRERAQNRERIEATGEAIWFHYPDGSGTTKLTPALLDRLIGSPATGRNVRTVQKLAELSSGKE